MRFNLMFPEDLKQALMEAAGRNATTASQVLRSAAVEYVDAHKAQSAQPAAA